MTLDAVVVAAAAAAVVVVVGHGVLLFLVVAAAAAVRVENRTCTRSIRSNVPPLFAWSFRVSQNSWTGHRRS